MVQFRNVPLPHPLTATETKAHQEIELKRPYANVAYRIEMADLGRTFKVTGEIRETDRIQALIRLLWFRRLSDGAVSVLNLEDDAGTTLNAKLGDVEYTITVGDWYPGYYRVPYTVTFLESQT